jgi:EAL domain-containing protein (putative c-di-GMP-specific phosphodiesterase class I)
MLEVTENAFMQDVSHAIILLECMRDLGIKVSIDDFGTGYSSLEQIKRLPVDELKIDQTFLTNIPGEAVDTAIVRSTIELAHNLGLKVVAEGVRTAEALRWLAAQGCEQAKGFYISKPLSADALIVWMQSRLATPQDETASNLRLVPTT